jgi:hypothetical protein
MRIGKKKLKEIKEIIRNSLSLSNVSPEFEDYYDDDTPPEFWTKEEKILCDYLGRVEREIIKDIENLLT